MYAQVENHVIPELIPARLVLGTNDEDWELRDWLADVTRSLELELADNAGWDLLLLFDLLFFELEDNECGDWLTKDMSATASSSSSKS